MRAVWLAWASLSALQAQTTQGLIFGRILDEVDHHAIPKASISCQNADSGQIHETKADDTGAYAFPLLPPGVYRLSITAGDLYRPAQINALELLVGAYLEQNVELRLLTDIWQRGQARSAFPGSDNTVVVFYGPDVDPNRSARVIDPATLRGGLEPSVSQVVDPPAIAALPLPGRDLYSTLLLQPGVTSDSATLRGLGFSVNGQRPSASNYLLDGFENNNHLVTGPVTIVTPEAMQEYRVSLNNFSAEYGRTSGFIANAVTRAGSGAWHGTGYTTYRGNETSATTRGSDSPVPDLPFRQTQFGFQAGGPVRRDSHFSSSSSFEYSRSRSSGAPKTVALPSSQFVQSLRPETQAYWLLHEFPAPPVSGNTTGLLTVEQTVSLDGFVGLQRIDWASPLSRHRVTGRFAISRLSRPDAYWSPYPGFTSPVDQNASNAGLAGTWTRSSHTTVEWRAGLISEFLGRTRPHPEVPYISAPATLPGSPVGQPFTYQSRNLELAGSALYTSGSHFLKVGGGAFLRWLNVIVGTPRAVYALDFETMDAFASDVAKTAEFPLGRKAAEVNQYRYPDLARRYSIDQFFGFLQDSYRLTPRLMLHGGVRYETFGSPRNTGSTPDLLVKLNGPGPLSESLRQATLAESRGRLYSADRNDWAGRAGFAWNLRSSGQTIVRGSYGIFYDRPFDNLWLNITSNAAIRGTASTGLRVNYQDGPGALIQATPARAVSVFPSDVDLTMYQPGFRTPYVQSFFLGLQHQPREGWLLEANYNGSLGRKLLTTDIVNRKFSSGRDRFATALPDIDYRGNQGASTYHGLTASARARFSHGRLQVSYTWSHSIDNQSEPLAGFASNLAAIELTSLPSQDLRATFTSQFDSRADRGNSDFDQRHNLVVYSTWDLPSPGKSAALRNWRVSQVAVFRSGSMFTVYGPRIGTDRNGYIFLNRADLVLPSALTAGTGDVAGGRRILSDAAFAEASGHIGSSGRNAFAGPGLYNVDVSVSRSFAPRPKHESLRVTLRADAFNLLNHANLDKPQLGDPNSVYCCLQFPDFGVATYGRHGLTSGLPSLAPAVESSRQVQLSFKVVF